MKLDKFQDTAYQFLSKSAKYCRSYDKKNVGVFFMPHSVENQWTQYSNCMHRIPIQKPWTRIPLKFMWLVLEPLSTLHRMSSQSVHNLLLYTVNCHFMPHFLMVNNSSLWSIIHKTASPQKSNQFIPTPCPTPPVHITSSKSVTGLPSTLCSYYRLAQSPSATWTFLMHNYLQPQLFCCSASSAQPLTWVSW